MRRLSLEYSDSSNPLRHSSPAAHCYGTCVHELCLNLIDNSLMSASSASIFPCIERYVCHKKRDIIDQAVYMWSCSGGCLEFRCCSFSRLLFLTHLTPIPLLPFLKLWPLALIKKERDSIISNPAVLPRMISNAPWDVSGDSGHLMVACIVMREQTGRVWAHVWM